MTADRSHGDPPFGLQRATRAAAEEGLVEPTDNALAGGQKEAPGIRVVPSWVVVVLGGRAKTASAAMRAGGKALWPGGTGGGGEEVAGERRAGLPGQRAVAALD